MTYLIISTNSNMKVKDWTPFDNTDKFLENSTIIKKNDLVTNSLNLLSIHKWKLKNTFSHKKYVYFVLKNEDWRIIYLLLWFKNLFSITFFCLEITRVLLGNSIISGLVPGLNCEGVSVSISSTPDLLTNV